MLAYQAKKGTLPEGIVRVFAALIRFYRGDRNGEPIALRDDAGRIAFFMEEWRRVLSLEQNLHQLVGKVLGKAEWWDTDLNTVPGLTNELTEALKKYQN